MDSQPMKVRSKMVAVAASPGRPEKLSRGKSGNRSRGRAFPHARSASMFLGRKSRNGRSSAVEIPDGKDPGSPKVTCIGQVTIKKKKKKKLDISSSSSSSTSSKKPERKNGRGPCCRWLQGGSLFRNPFSTTKSSLTPPPSLWRRWLSSSCSWSYQKEIPKEEENSGDVDMVVGPLDRFEWRCEETKVQAPTPTPTKEQAIEEEEKEEEVFVPATPPKNALLLMRCRSAPHRSSALVASFDREKETNPPADIAGNVKVESDRERSSDEENNISPEDVGNASCGESLKDEEEDAAASFSSRPLILSRSNSGPAKLVSPETNSPCFSGISSNNGNNSSSKTGKKIDSALANESFPK